MNKNAKRKPALFILSGDDWEALYADGACVFQGHSVNAFHIAHHGKNGAEKIEARSLTEEGRERYENTGKFPMKLSEVPTEFII